MHGEHAEAQRAANHAGLGNNYSGGVHWALLWITQTGAEKKYLGAQLSQTLSVATDSPQQPGQVTCRLWGSTFLKGEVDYTD